MNVRALAALSVAAVGLIIAATPALAGEGHTPVTFCHNGHTITTDDDGQINGHTKHVESGKDSLGPCPTQEPTPTPTVTEEPCPTPTTTATPSSEPTPSVTPSVTPTTTPSATPTETPTETPTSKPSETPSATPTSAPSPSATPSSTAEVASVATLAETGARWWDGIAVAVGLILLGCAAVWYGKRTRQ